MKMLNGHYMRNLSHLCEVSHQSVPIPHQVVWQIAHAHTCHLKGRNKWLSTPHLSAFTTGDTTLTRNKLSTIGRQGGS
jgi:hypothetical protein